MSTKPGNSFIIGGGSATHSRPTERAAEREQLFKIGGADLRDVAHGRRLVAYYHYMIRFLDTQR
jgi:hypothetical protein